MKGKKRIFSETGFRSCSHKYDLCALVKATVVCALQCVSESNVRVTASDGFSQPSLLPVCASFVSLLVDASFGEADTYSGI